MSKKSGLASQAEHHLHVRRRREPFPSKQAFKRLIDRMVFVAGPLIPIAIAPTAYEAIVKNETEGINLITWGTLTVTSAIMAIYACIHREWPLILTYIPLFVLNAVIVLGVVLK